MTDGRRVPIRGFDPARTLAILALAGGIVLGAGRGAEAQFLFDGDILPPRVIAWRLSERGFSGMTRPRYDGRVYVVEAVDPAGVQVRLFVDPAVGAILGRRRLGGPDGYGRQDYARLERPAPGFGWTDEDPGPRRLVRPLPREEDAAPVPRSARRPAIEAVRPDPNPSGLNPDGGARIEAPRKVARAAATARPPDLKPAARTTPEAPAPKLLPTEPKAEISAASTDQPSPAATPAKPAAVAESVRGDAAKAAVPEWKDPPAEGRRPVRVIEGATVVPGTTEPKDGAQ